MQPSNYLGQLPFEDPLYDYLRQAILPRMHMRIKTPRFEVYKLPGSGRAYLYLERQLSLHIVGKFFGGNTSPPEVSLRNMQREFDNLCYLQEPGFMGHPYYTPRPIDCNPSINFVLVEEFCHGESLDRFLLQAIHQGGHAHLAQKFSALASFFKMLHRQSSDNIGIDFERESAYSCKIVKQLKNAGHLSYAEADRFLSCLNNRRGIPAMWRDRRVLVHGDATPPNFLFGENGGIAAVDLERMRFADRMFDLGRAAAEIKHFYMQYADDKTTADRLIRHFYGEYFQNLADRSQSLSSVSERAAFYEGTTLLRIARNSWHTPVYRRKLIEEAANVLSCSL